MVWEERPNEDMSSSCPSAPRKFYETNIENNITTNEVCNSDDLISYIANNIIGKDSVFESPYGIRKGKLIL